MDDFVVTQDLRRFRAAWENNYPNRLRTMNGFRIDYDSQNFPGPIETVVLPLLSKYWLICTQSGPFSIADKPNFEELDAETSSFMVDVPEFRNTDVHLFRPGVFPRFTKRAFARFLILAS